MLLNNNGKETNKREGTNIFLVFFLFLVLCLLLANHDVNMLHVIHISFFKDFLYIVLFSGTWAKNQFPKQQHGLFF